MSANYKVVIHLKTYIHIYYTCIEYYIGYRVHTCINIWFMFIIINYRVPNYKHVHKSYMFSNYRLQSRNTQVICLYWLVPNQLVLYSHKYLTNKIAIFRPNFINYGLNISYIYTYFISNEITNNQHNKLI